MFILDPASQTSSQFASLCSAIGLSVIPSTGLYPGGTMPSPAGWPTK